MVVVVTGVVVVVVVAMVDEERGGGCCHHTLRNEGACVVAGPVGTHVISGVCVWGGGAR
jgi:hypothetical protein